MNLSEVLKVLKYDGRQGAFHLIVKTEDGDMAIREAIVSMDRVVLVPFDPVCKLDENAWVLRSEVKGMIDQSTVSPQGKKALLSELADL